MYSTLYCVCVFVNCACTWSAIGAHDAARLAQFMVMAHDEKGDTYTRLMSAKTPELRALWITMLRGASAVAPVPPVLEVETPDTLSGVATSAAAVIAHSGGGGGGGGGGGVTDAAGARARACARQFPLLFPLGFSVPRACAMSLQLCRCRCRMGRVRRQCRSGGPGRGGRDPLRGRGCQCHPRGAARLRGHQGLFVMLARGGGGGRQRLCCRRQKGSARTS